MRKFSYRIRWFAVAFALAAALFVPSPSQAQVAVGVYVSFPPPDLPVYDQPVCPGDDYIWTPGFWSWDPDFDDYYWVPGTWVSGPEPGFFWTPGYWAWGPSGFFFTAGYWGPVVGFYGGINYGFGYFGHGYGGGRWDRGHFYYNRSVTNVNVTVVHNVYNTTVINENRNVTRVSFNGGNGGVNARPTSQEQAAAREHHIAPVAAQMQHIQTARRDQQLRASVNHGAPPVAATPRPEVFSGNGVVRAREAGAMHERTGGNAARSENNRPGNNAARPPNNPNRPAETERPENNRPPTSAEPPNTVIHPRDIPRADRPPAPNTGNPKLDQKYQRDQEKLVQQQQQERQKLERQQDNEDQRMQKQANEGARREVEQRHQQQTEQMQQRHAEQNQRMQQRQEPHPAPPKHPQDKPHS